MIPKNSIKIVKKEQRDALKPATAKTEAESGQSLRQATREVAGNVAAWVREFKERSTPKDARRAFASLFAEPASL